MSRDRWSSRSIFVLAAIGSAVGLGNAWRFPGICYSNGGGAFLIPYFVAMLTAGIPLLILELSIGKKFQGGSPTAFASLNKRFEVLGWWALATSFIIICYYAVVMSWVLDYIIYSVTLPWKGIEGGAAAFFTGKSILGISDSPGILGGFSIPALLGLIVAWIAIWWCIRNGVKSVGKVVKYTVSLPIILLIILAVRGITLPGGIDGIAYYLTPNWAALGDIKVWAAAYGQVFFSLSILFGIMVAYASYLPKNTDIPSNAMVIAFSDAAISFVAGFAVFGTLGYMQMVSGTPIADMRHTGVMLAFATYPEAIVNLPGPGIIHILFALIFFLMLFTLGIDSAFSIVEGIVTGLVDKFKWNKRKTTAWFCVIGFAGGLIFVTKAGLYWLDIMDHWVNDFNLIAIGVFECIMVGWIFGAKKLRDYFNKGTATIIGKWWDIMIRYITPLVLLFTSVRYLIENIANPYGGYDQKYLLIGGCGIVLLTLILGIVFTLFKGAPEQIAEESETPQVEAE